MSACDCPFCPELVNNKQRQNWNGCSIRCVEVQNRSKNQALSPLLCLCITATAAFSIPSARAETNIAEFSAIEGFPEEEMSFSSASIELDIDKERFQNNQNLTFNGLSRSR